MKTDKRNFWGHKICAAAVIGCMAAGILSGCGKEEETVVRESSAAVGQGQTVGQDQTAGQGQTVGQDQTAGQGQTVGQDQTAGQGQTVGQGQTTGQGQTAGQSQTTGAAAQVLTAADTGSMFTDRDLSGEYDGAECVGIELGSENVTITEEGVYILSGSLTEGMVIVDADDAAKVQLVLDNAEISNSSGAAIYVRQAEKVFITLAEGTVNTLSGGDSYESIDDNNIDGIIFSKSDLVINGEGSLNITAVTGHGIVSKDDLKVTGGILTIYAPGHGLAGKDSVRIAGGTLNITSGKDGIHSENADNEEKGFVYIADGSISSVSEGDGISAGAYLQIDGGSFTVDSQDDSLHSNGDLVINGGTFSIATGDDGMHADGTVTVAGGIVDIFACYEGIEGKNVVISEGCIRIYATDDGLNAAGGNDGSGFGGRFGGDFKGEAADDSAILISGGLLYVNADGDGIDSNGNITVSGGEIYISGPESSANSALDCEGSAQITGGRLIATGNAGMAMNFGESSTQGSALIRTSDCKAGTEIRLEDSEGNVLVSYTAESGFNSVVVSCPEMVQGGTYTLCAGEEEYEVTLESLIYGNGFGGFGGGRGGMGGPGGTEGFGGMGGPPPVH